MPSADRGGVDGVREGVVVLGMHRSGTSATTRLLTMLGLAHCSPDDLITDPRGNPKGHWESGSMVRENVSLLDQMGRAWWCPPRAGDRYAVDAAGIETEPSDAAARFDAVHPNAPWVWKDPRTCLTLPFWRSALDRPIAAVVVVRNPLDVAASLRARNQLRTTLGIAMWARTNRLILEHLAGLPALVTTYDDLVTDPQAWCQDARDFLAGLGMTATHDADVDMVTDFVDADLRHSRHSTLDVAAEVATVLPILEAMQAVGGAWDTFPGLDLSPEPAWIEAEFADIGSWQPTRLPRDTHVVRSVIAVARGEGAETVASVAAALAADLPPFTEAIVVTDGEAPAEVPAGVRVLTVDPGTTSGEARQHGVDESTGGIVELRSAAVTVDRNWVGEQLRALAAGYAAVSPAIASPTGTGYGLHWAEGLELRWGSRPDESVSSAPVLANSCLAVDRDVLEAVGGLDPALGAYGVDVQELSLRLANAGHRCAIARNATATVPPVPPSRPDWAGYIRDILRVAIRHADEASIASLLARVSDKPGAATAIAGVLVAADQAAVSVSSQREFDASPPTRRARSGSVPPRSDRPTVIVVGDGTDSSGNDAAADRLDRQLAGTADVVVAADRADAVAAIDRAAGPRVAVIDAAVDPSSGWLGGLVATAERCGVGVAVPSVTGVGLSWPAIAGVVAGRGLDDLRLVRAGDAEVAVLGPATGCLLVDRQAYDAAGGYDPALVGSPWADLELCLRIWRAGWACVSAPGSRVATVQRTASIRNGWWDDNVAGFLRICAIHLAAADHAAVLTALRTRRGFAAAAGDVAAMRCGPRRLAVQAAMQRSTADVLTEIAAARRPPRPPTATSVGLLDERVAVAAGDPT
jgi:GT2 family glycosyltransferase